ncbi:MAG: 2-keto-3-deoxygluconate permease [Verrucomicrobia bacterium]|nr:2-keto-3-deoxygluconate permease [Verrucomicrobiota bacterium]MCH8511440.1 2-keto-3-deoxygluconate permease [Kiritimatiellia bacterium]
MAKLTDSLGKIPGGLMVIPLLAGAFLNTVDRMYLTPVQRFLRVIGAPSETREVIIGPEESFRELWENQVVSETTLAETGERVLEIASFRFLNLGTFSTALASPGILTLIAMFLFCVGAQMDFHVGKRSLKKGLVITLAKLGAAMVVAYLIAKISGSMYHGFLGLSAMAVIAAMENGNGGMYVALTGEYGNRSDVGAISVVSLNDGPFFTLLALGMMGEVFPIAAFLAVLLPMGLGFTLAQIDPKIRQFTAPGEKLTIPFFAFALGTAMNLGTFLQMEVLGAGLFLALCTIVVTGGAAVLALRLFREESPMAGICEASTAGNATQTPVAVAGVMAAGVETGIVSPEKAAIYQDLVLDATAQISISVITTAIILPFVVIWYDKKLRAKGIDPRKEIP